MSRLMFRPGRKTILGMIHLKPLPGTPYYEDGDFPHILETAVRSARALREGGADGCLVQTVDRVYSTEDTSDPARTAAMALVVRAVADATTPDFHVGVHMLRNAVKASLGVATVAGGSYVRAGALVGQTPTTHGVVAPDPLDIMTYRKAVGASGTAVIADIDSMHFSVAGAALSTAQMARGAAQVGADAVAVGHADEERTLSAVAAVREAAPGLPVVLAGHTRHENAARLLRAADGAFVGTCLEHGGWGGSIDVDLVRDYVRRVRAVEN
jgi:membrane complex biogenesis BtpA family protein